MPRIRSRISATIYNENQESKKAAARAIYNGSPEMKRAAYLASYRADPKEQRAASRVASRASCIPPRVPLFKAYLCSCCMLWSARISWFMTETDSTYFTTRPNQTTTAHTMIKQKKLLPQKWQKQVKYRRSGNTWHCISSSERIQPYNDTMRKASRLNPSERIKGYNPGIQITI